MLLSNSFSQLTFAGSREQSALPSNACTRQHLNQMNTQLNTQGQVNQRQIPATFLHTSEIGRRFPEQAGNLQQFGQQKTTVSKSPQLGASDLSVVCTCKYMYRYLIRYLISGYGTQHSSDSTVAQIDAPAEQSKRAGAETKDGKPENEEVDILGDANVMSWLRNSTW